RVLAESGHMPLAEDRGAVAAVVLQVLHEGMMPLRQPVRVVEHSRLRGEQTGEQRRTRRRAERLDPRTRKAHTVLGQGVEGRGRRGPSVDLLVIRMPVPRRAVLLDEAL